METENDEYFAIYFGLFRFWLYQSELIQICMVPTLSEKLGDCLKMQYFFILLFF